MGKSRKNLIGKPKKLAIAQEVFRGVEKTNEKSS